MANSRQPELVTAANTTTSSMRSGNDQNEDSNTHEGNHDMVDSIKEDFDLLWRLRKYLVLLGILAVSVTYNAGLTPPGGFWALNKDGHDAGDPVLRVGFSQRYEVFFYCNATAFAASLVLIILLLSKTVTRQEMWLRSMQFTMILDLFSLMGAYAAGSCRAPKSSIYIWVLVFAVFVYVGIHILVFIRVIPETFKEKVQRKLSEILSKWGISGSEMNSRQEKDIEKARDIEEARKFILMLVTFAATVTYQAGLSPPGGFWAENDYVPSAIPPRYKHPPATSVLRSNYLRRYNIFVSFNSSSFVASLVIILLLLSPELSKHGIRSKAVIMCVVADLLCLVGAYAAGCCRDVATSFYVMFIIIIVLICFVFLSGIFVYQPVADWQVKVKSECRWCMGELGQVLSGKFGSNAEQESSHASHHKHSVHSKGTPAEDNASESEHQFTGNQQVSNTKEGESHEEHPPADKEQAANTKDSVSNSQHPSWYSQQSANTEDVVSNLEYQSKDCQLVANVEESKSSTEQEHPSVSCQQTANTKDSISTDNQQVASTMDKSSTVISVEGLSEQNMSASDYNGSTDCHIADEGPSVPVEASGNVDFVQQRTSVGDDNHDIEIGGIHNNAKCSENGHIESNLGAPNQTSDDNPASEHLEKTRTYLLLLAILAVSVTYQSGLNPPGGFWSRSEYDHSAGDRILEDTYHPRFIAFFYLNAIAFVASIVMINMLLDKMMSKTVIKRRALQITMIVALLSLTGAFVMGSSREAKKSIYISVLVCLVLAYVVIHVLIAIHIIPQEWKKQVAQKLKQFSCGHVWSANNQTRDDTSEKQWERRRNLLLTLSILAATVTYQAGMNPPGGVWSDDEHVSGEKGNPILQDTHPKRYDVFYYSNSVSFVSSVVITILLVNKESCEHGIKSYALRVCLVVGLLGLLIAYVAGSCRNRIQSVCLIIIAVAVLISLVTQVLLSSTHDTLGRPLSQFVEFLQRLLFRAKMVGREPTSETLKPSECDEIVRKKPKFLMLLAILAASITYQGGLNPPGGFWSESDKSHVAGNPVLHDINHRRYKTFFCFNSFAFMASIVVIMLLLSKSVRKKDVLLEVLHLTMILDLLALMTAFAAGSCRKFNTSVYVYALVIGVVIYLVLVVGLSSGIAKCLRSRERSGLASRSRRHPEHASRTNTPMPGQQA